MCNTSAIAASYTAWHCRRKDMNMSIYKRWTVVSIAFLLAACGGGDSKEPMTAAACFDVGTFAGGAEISQKLSRGTRLEWRVSAQTTTYNQIPNVLKVTNDVVWEDGMPGVQSYHSDFHIDPVTAPEVTSHGTYYVSGSNFTRVALTEVYSAPYTDKRFTLKQGETLQYSYSGTATQESLYGPDAGVKVHDFTKSGTVKFEGLEDVAIGERTVKACKFAEGSNKAWYYRGLQIQFQNPDKPIENFGTTMLTRSGDAY